MREVAEDANDEGPDPTAEYASDTPSDVVQNLMSCVRRAHPAVGRSIAAVSGPGIRLPRQCESQRASQVLPAGKRPRGSYDRHRSTTAASRPGICCRHLCERHVAAAQHSSDHGARSLALEGPLAREQFVREHPEREHVGRRSHFVAAGLLGGHVRHRADTPAVRVRSRFRSRNFARPKSASLTRPSSRRNTLAGLISRWTIPCS